MSRWLPTGGGRAARGAHAPRARRRYLAVGAAAVAVALAAGGAAAALRPGPPGVRTVELTMHYTHFQPATLRVEPGTTVRFVLRNTDPIDHEFIVGDAATHQKHRVGRERHHHGNVPGEVSVAAGAEAATTYRFETPGQVKFICHLPGHEAYGMVGTVTVG